MGIMNGLGALLGGASEEAGKIHEERFKKELANHQTAAEMFKFILESPNTTPEVKAQALKGWHDINMEKMFPDQFKGDTKNPVRKLVDQFIGQQDASPAMAHTMEQFGVGTGNGKTPVGSATPQGGPGPMPPPMPEALSVGQMDTGNPTDSGAVPADASASGMPAIPPAPNDIFGISPPESIGGFERPGDRALYDQARLTQMQGKASQAQFFDKANQAMSMLSQHPEFRSLSSQQRAQLQASLVGGTVSPEPMGALRDSYNASNGKMETQMIAADGTIKTISTSDLAPSASEKEYKDMAKALFDAKDPKVRGLNVDQIAQGLRLQDYVQDQAAKAALTKYRNHLADVQSALLPPAQKQMYEQGKVIYQQAEAMARKEQEDTNKAQAAYDAAVKLSPEIAKVQVQPKPFDLSKAIAKHAEEIAEAQGINKALLDNINKVLAQVHQQAIDRFEKLQSEAALPIQ